MERLAVISIIISDRKQAEKVNQLLSEYGEWVIGRMGIPHRARGLQVISIVIDAPMDAISALSGKLGRLPDVTTKVAYAPEANGGNPDAARG